MKKKSKKHSPTGWVDELKTKLSDWNKSQEPEKTPKEEWPTYFSEHRKRMESKDPTATGLATFEPEEEKKIP